MLQFRILGALEVVDGDELPPLGGPRQRALLALLLLHPGQALSIDRIVDELWGEQAPKTATTSLHNFLTHLRKLLGHETLVTRPAGYVLRIEPEQLDATRFERLVAQARQAEVRERAPMLQEALALWRGPALDDLAFEAFAQPEIRRLEELRLQAVEERLDAELELGGAAQLVAELEALVEQNPLRERLRAQLMLALYRSGRQAEALDAFRGARRALVDELGIEPSPALVRLHASILRQESRLQPLAATAVPGDHFAEVAEALLAGRLVMVLGPGVNACGRPDGAAWSKGDGQYLPDSGELASHLAGRFDGPPEQAGDLAGIAQYVALTKGVGPLHDELHDVFDEDYAPGPVHRFEAALPALLRAAGAPPPLLVTTSFDTALERAFADAGEQADIISYIAAGRDQGKFLHVAPDGSATVIHVPNTYTGLAQTAPAILGIHGQVDRDAARARESFVVSEDDYIAYLAQTDVAGVLPVSLAARLQRSHFLFLGYAVEQWSLRVFLHRLFGDEPLSYRSWAVKPAPEPLEREFWRRRQVDVFDVPLDAYVAELRTRLEAS